MRAAVQQCVANRLGREVADLLLPGAPDAATAPGPDAVPLGVPLDREMPWEALAAAYPGLLETGQRKQRGTWYTAPRLAAPTARRALAPLLAAAPGQPFRIVDPAVGGGSFLLAALRELRGAGVPARPAALSLHGLDIDGTAAALAALALWSAAGLPKDDLPAIAANVRHGDGLLELPDGSFDAVLTNPPWETLQSTPTARPRAAALRPRFHHQGRGKLYTYRLFVERMHQLLRPGGRFGMVVPASLWFDRDAAPLRQLLLDDCAWEWLHGFENTRQLFPIDRRYRFAAIVGQKGGSTQAVKVAFGRLDLDAWDRDAPAHTRYGRAQIDALSPHSGTFVEVEHERDLALLLAMQQRSAPLVGRDGAFAWRQGDFNMTGDRGLFVSRIDAERDGYGRGPDGRWRRQGDDDALLPLYQGAMVNVLQPNAGAHRGGTGFQTAWEEPAGPDDLRPCYLVHEATWASRAHSRADASLVLRTLSNATNERSAIACLLPAVPCGNSLGVLTPHAATALPLRQMACGAAVLGSLPFDWALRLRLSGTNLNGFLLAECRMPRLAEPLAIRLAQAALRLCAVLPWHAGLWATARDEGWAPAAGPATSPAERAGLLTTIDVLVGGAFGCTADDVAWVVRGCDAPTPPGRRGALPGPAKGLWRVDRALPPAARRPNRWLAAARSSASS